MHHSLVLHLAAKLITNTLKEIALQPSFCPSFCLHCYTFSVALFCVAVYVAEFDRMMTIKTYGLAVTV